MQQWLVPLVTAVLSLAGAVGTAWLAMRGKRAEVQQTGWGTLSEAWERRLEELENDRTADRTELAAVKAERRADRRRMWLYHEYVRTMLSWARARFPDEPVPEPPAELADELAPYTRRPRT